MYHIYQIIQELLLRNGGAKNERNLLAESSGGNPKHSFENLYGVGRLLCATPLSMFTGAFFNEKYIKGPRIRLLSISERCYFHSWGIMADRTFICWGLYPYFHKLIGLGVA